MGVALGWIALTLAGVAAAPRTEQAEVEIGYTVRFVEIEGLGWRQAVVARLTPVARQGAATVWTAPRGAAQRLIDTALKDRTANVLQAPRVTARSGSPVHVSARANQRFITQVAWSGDDRPAPGEPETVRTGSVATMAGRKLDQGILVQLVLEDTEIRAIHRVNLSGCGAHGCSGPPTAAAVKSQVFMGQGNAAGLSAYAYQVTSNPKEAGCCAAGEALKVAAIPEPSECGPRGTIAEVRIEGNATIPAEKIKSKLLSRAGWAIDGGIIKADLKSLMETKWFSEVSSYYKESPPKSGNFILTFCVRENPSRTDTTTKPACAADCNESSACCQLQSKATARAMTAANPTASVVRIFRELDRCEDGVVQARFDSMCPASAPCTAPATAASCMKDNPAGMVALEVPEIGSQEIAGEWLIPKGGVLLVSFGPHTVAGPDGKAVIHERLAIIEAEEAADVAVIPRASRAATLLPAPRPATTTAAPPIPAPMAKLPMAVPALPSRSIPQGFHADGRPADLPPLPPDEAAEAPAESSEARPSPQTKKSQQPQSPPKPPADSGTNKAEYSLPKMPVIPSLFLPAPSVGLQFLIPLKPLSLQLPFNRRLEIEIFGRVVRDATPNGKSGE